MKKGIGKMGRKRLSAMLAALLTVSLTMGEGMSVYAQAPIIIEETALESTLVKEAETTATETAIEETAAETAAEASSSGGNESVSAGAGESGSGESGNVSGETTGSGEAASAGTEASSSGGSESASAGAGESGPGESGNVSGETAESGEAASAGSEGSGSGGNESVSEGTGESGSGESGNVSGETTGSGETASQDQENDASQASGEERDPETEEETLPEETEQGSEVSTETGAEAQTEADTSGTTRIIAWSFVDFYEVLDWDEEENCWTLTIPGVSSQDPAKFEEVTALLPGAITAATVRRNADSGESMETQETVSLAEWKCEAYPAEGAYEGDYLFAAKLPEGYELDGEAAKPEVRVLLGGMAELLSEADAVASVEIGGVTEYYSDLQEAFAAAAGQTAKIQLLQDVELEEQIAISGADTRITLDGGEFCISYGEGTAISLSEGTLTITDGTITGSENGIRARTGSLIVNDGTITGSGDCGIYVSSGAEVTINGGKISGRYGVYLWSSYGSVTVTGGTLNGSIDGILVQSGTFSVSGGTVTGQVAMQINNRNGVKLSGGTFSGSMYSIRIATYDPVSDVLEEGYDYFRENGSRIDGTKDYYLRGVVTVGECVHQVESWKDRGDNLTHSGTCTICGKSVVEPHVYEGETGICTVCQAEVVLVAQVEADGAITQYTDLSEAFRAANGKTARITLLSDVKILRTEGGSRCVISGGNVTLDLNGYLLTVENTSIVENRQGAVHVSGGSLTVGGGSISSTIALSCTGGLLTVSSGTYNGDLYAIYVDSSVFEGGVVINGGTFQGDNTTFYQYSGNVTVNGGEFLSQAFFQNTNSAAITLNGGRFAELLVQKTTLGDVLGESCFYRLAESGAWITEEETLNGIEISETVDVLSIRITKQPEDKVLDFQYTQEDAWISVEAELGWDAAEEIAYQWYRLGEDGAAEELTDENGYSGTASSVLSFPTGWKPGTSESYYCVITCEGWTLQSETATVSVPPCGHENISADGVCQICGEKFTVCVTAGGELTYYQGIDDAWAAAKEKSSDSVVAEVTLLANTTATETLTVEAGDNILLNSSLGATYTVSGALNILIQTTGGTLEIGSGRLWVSIRRSGVAVQGIRVEGGTVRITGGEISTNNTGFPSGTSYAMCVTGGSVAVSGNPVFSAAGNGIGTSYGLRVDGGTVALYGGTYSGTLALYASNYLRSLLGEGCGFYKDGVLVTDLDRIAPSLTSTLTVSSCTHSNVWQDNGDGTHTGVCVVCGHEEEEAAAHEYTPWADNEDGTHSRSCSLCGREETESHVWDQDGNCTAEGCEATTEIVAKVTIGSETTYYDNIADAWEAARGKTAEITLLKSVELTGTVLDVSDSASDITLNMSDGVTLFEMDDDSGILVTAGRFVLAGGSIWNGSWGSGYKQALKVEGGTVEVTGGTIVSGNIGIEVWGGLLEMKGGTVESSYSSVAVWRGDGTAVISGGSMLSTQAVALYVQGTSSSATVYGGEIHGEMSGLKVAVNANVVLAGGTFSSPQNSISCDEYTMDQNVQDLLKTGYAYYYTNSDGEKLQITDEETLSGYSLLAEKGYGTVTVEPIQGSEETISVSIEWGAMNFVYEAETAWDPDTHTYAATGEGSWQPEAEEGAGAIRVTNDSSVPVEVQYQFTQDTDVQIHGLEQVTGSFFSDAESFVQEEGAGSSLLTAQGGTEIVTFLPEGAPESPLEGTEILGNITVTIGEVQEGGEDGA